MDSRLLLERIRTRFGVPLKGAEAVARLLQVETRYVVRDFQAVREAPRPAHSNPELAAVAVSRALHEAGVAVGDLGYLIGHTATPHWPIPSNVAEVAVLLGFEGPFCEFRQACTGFVNALIFAQGILSEPGARPVAVVGSETGSVFLNPLRVGEDRAQLVNLLQMGDAAAAVILGPPSRGCASIESVYHGQQSSRGLAGLSLPQGGSANPGCAGEVLEFHHDYEAIGRSGLDLLRAGLNSLPKAGLTPEDISHFIPHQASGRIGRHLRPYLPDSAVVVVQAERVGNTGSAAIWLALDDVRRTLKPGQRLWVLGAEATRAMYGGFMYVPG
ncbi:3-oxoacyl-ACP synthase [bacterium]|nr:3-oxoacyl-ACP synthase [bacterium]